MAGRQKAEVKAAVLRLWNEGKSQRQIAIEMKVSRGTISGIIHRTPGAKRTHNPMLAPNVIQLRPQPPKPKPKPAPVAPTVIGPAGAFPASGCQYTEDEVVGNSDWRMCGHVEVPGTKFCEYHCGIVYNGLPPRKMLDVRRR